MIKNSLSLCFLFLLAACSNSYASRHACEKALSEDRGAIAGVLVGGAFGDGKGKILTSVGGGVAGHVAGGILYSPQESDDHRPYTRNRFTGIFTGCKPVQDE